MCEIFFKSCVNNDHASLKEFDKVFGDGGYIDNFNKKCHTLARVFEYVFS